MELLGMIFFLTLERRLHGNRCHWAFQCRSTSTSSPWHENPTLTALRPSLQITADCWALLAAPDGSTRKERYLPKGKREPVSAYRMHLDAARPSGFFGMLSRGSWISLPVSLTSLLTDVHGRGTDLGVFLAAADLLVLRDGAALALVLPPPGTAGRARATVRRPCAAVIACPSPGCSWSSAPSA
jgi:hypothetical protein